MRPSLNDLRRESRLLDLIGDILLIVGVGGAMMVATMALMR